jgi:hypothetical protein
VRWLSRAVYATARGSLQGAVFAAVKAAVDRAAGVGTQKLTGTWPGNEGHREWGKKAGQ